MSATLIFSSKRLSLREMVRESKWKPKTKWEYASEEPLLFSRGRIYENTVEALEGLLFRGQQCTLLRSDWIGV
jgi:hypothetical protein